MPHQDEEVSADAAAVALMDPVSLRSSDAIIPDPFTLHNALTLQVPLSKERVRSTSKNCSTITDVPFPHHWSYSR